MSDRVLIVGAGVGGLAAAMVLAAAAVPVQVWEMGADVGGQGRHRSHSAARDSTRDRAF